MYDPYLDTLGGGERYFLSLAEYLLENDFQVDILWDQPNNQELIKTAEVRFGLDLKKLFFIDKPSGLVKKFLLEKDYDFIFWISDGSIPFLFGKNNVLHQQVPFHNVKGKSLTNRIKLKRINHVVCNSKFTKNFIDIEYGVDSMVVYPPIDVLSFTPGKKEKVILSVGRFSNLLQAKRQDILIEVFKRIVSDGLQGWKLVLAGGTDVGGRDYFKELERSAKLFPIEFEENCSFEKLKTLYSKASLYWHAAGYNINEQMEPQKVEHFGMTTVEAMAAGCVPVVMEKGGQKEIVKEGENGYLWLTEENLIDKTIKIIEDKKLLEKLSKEVVKSSRNYSKDRFYQAYEQIIKF